MKIVSSARCVVAIVCVAFGTCVVARAQSAVDAFDPGVNSSVRALAVQPDGKTIVGGDFTMLGGGGTGTTARDRIGRLNVDGSIDTGFNPGTSASVYALAVQPDGKILVGGTFVFVGNVARSKLARLNANGSVDTSFAPSPSNDVYALAVQPDGKILVGGFFGSLGGVNRSNLGRINADGSLDTSFNPGADAQVNALVVQADGKIVVGGAFTMLGGGGTGTTTRNRIGRLNADGSLDPGFNPGADAAVNTLSLQADGEILVGGAFTALGGGTGTTARNRIGRLNTDGALDSFNPGANGAVQTLAVHPNGQILIGGSFTALGGGTGTTTRNRLGRLTAAGAVDAAFNPGANNTVLAVTVQPDGQILAGGSFTLLGGGGTGTTTRNRIGRLNTDGSTEIAFDPGANGLVLAMAVQPDGRILVGGDFSTLGGGGTGTTTRNRLGRLNADGSLDTSFNPGANARVYALVLQPDGKILVGGNFTTLGGGGTGTTTRNYLARLNADGSVDTSFNPGANSSVLCMAVQPDGRIVVGGVFSMLGGGGTGTTARNRLGRLNADGSLDTSFNPGANSPAYSLAVQADGKILVGGELTALGGGTGTTARNFLGRLNADGSIDTAFNPGANSTVAALVVEADGRILVGGSFTTLGGGGTGTTTRNRLGRLNANGSLDTAFNPGAGESVSGVTVQSDGRILVSGYFTTLGGGGTGTTTRNGLGRLNADGSLDASFNPGTGDAALAIAVQPDGKIVATGYFTTLGGGGTGTAPRKYLGRLTATGAAIQSLAVASGGSTITWSRSGTGQEVWRTTFESSTDGVTYSSLGSGTRVAGGWQLTGQSLAVNQNIFVRARGYHPASDGGSGSFVESTKNVYVSCPVVAPSLLAGATTGVPYSTTFTTFNALGIVSFQLTGALPTGVAFSAGVLSGTPTQAGIFQFTVSATDTSSGCTGSRFLTWAVTMPTTVSVDRTLLAYAAVSTGAAFTSQTGTQAVRVTQNGPGTVTWTASSNKPWLVVSPTSGTGPAALSVSVQFVPGLVAGQTGAIVFTFTGASNTAGPVSTVLNVAAPAATKGPFGVLDTPVGDATVLAGSIAVTGWSLDDVGVARVELWRDLQPGETTPPFASTPTDPRNGKVFLSNATFVDGARPDVQALYPTTPLTYRAGWGYLLLTWGLWNQGNGTYKLYAFAFDQENNVATIGAKTIVVSNNAATKPFGSIDTPGIGAVASGPNFGWALTPRVNGVATCKIQSPGVQVSIDSGPLQPVAYGDLRSDIAGAFPGFSNSNGAGGNSLFDWSTLSTGAHTIGWFVTDDCNRADGVGSRFFTVTSGTGLVAGATTERARIAGPELNGVAAPQNDSVDAITVARGYGQLPVIVPPGEAGSRTIEVKQGERIEVRVPRGFEAAYQLVDGKQRALPTGASWDASSGTLYWQPAAGFLGRYRIVFASATERISVRVVVVP